MQAWHPESSTIESHEILPARHILFSTMQDLSLVIGVEVVLKLQDLLLKPALHAGFWCIRGTRQKRPVWILQRPAAARCERGLVRFRCGKSVLRQGPPKCSDAEASAFSEGLLQGCRVSSCENSSARVCREFMRLISTLHLDFKKCLLNCRPQPAAMR